MQKSCALHNCHREVVESFIGETSASKYTVTLNCFIYFQRFSIFLHNSPHLPLLQRFKIYTKLIFIAYIRKTNYKYIYYTLLKAYTCLYMNYNINIIYILCLPLQQQSLYIYIYMCAWKITRQLHGIIWK